MIVARESTVSIAIRGVLPVIQTPYDESERIDFETLAREIDWLFEQGVDGLVLAMVSEVLRLTDAERSEMTEFVCEHTAGRGPVIASVGAESNFVAAERARHAESVGASAVMAIPPLSIPLEEPELRRYYERILEAVPIPVIVQDASGYVGRPMSIEFQADLRRDYGPRVLFKPEAQPIGPRLSELLEATDGQAAVFEGSGGAELVDSHRRGIVGTMPSADTIDALIVLWNALERGDDVVAARIDQALQPLLALQKTLDGYLAVEKFLLVKRGLFRNEVIRGPVGFQLNDAMKAEVETRFVELQRIVTECQ